MVAARGGEGTVSVGPVPGQVTVALAAAILPAGAIALGICAVAGIHDLNDRGVLIYVGVLTALSLLLWLGCRARFGPDDLVVWRWWLRRRILWTAVTGCEFFTERAPVGESGSSGSLQWLGLRLRDGRRVGLLPILGGLLTPGSASTPIGRRTERLMATALAQLHTHGVTGPGGSSLEDLSAVQALWQRCGVRPAVPGPGSVHRDTGRWDGSLPETVVHLGDGIAAGLSPETGETLFAAAVHPGADLSLVPARFLLWLLSDPEHGVITTASDEGQRSVETVSGLYARVVAGETVSDGQWSAALVTAWNAETGPNGADARAHHRWSATAYEAWISGQPHLEPAPTGDAYSDARNAAFAAGYAAWTQRSPQCAAEAVRLAAQAGPATYPRMAAKLRQLLTDAPHSQ
jgi:hypothetical protein